MILLDLFCGAGGAAKGYADAGFEIVGVDIEWQGRYPYTFIQMDALKFLREYADGFDAIHASPPCQAYSVTAHQHKREHPRLIEPTRELLLATGLPYVIENVPGAPLINPAILCGTMFPPLRVIRHRLFETNWTLTAPAEHPAHPVMYSTDRRKPNTTLFLSPYTSFVQVYGGGQAPIAAQRTAMGIPWMIRKELNQSIPPAYTEYVGRQLACLLSP